MLPTFSFFNCLNALIPHTKPLCKRLLWIAQLAGESNGYDIGVGQFGLWAIFSLKFFSSRQMKIGNKSPFPNRILCVVFLCSLENVRGSAARWIITSVQNTVSRFQ